MQVTSLPSRIHVSRPFSPCSLRMLRSLISKKSPPNKAGNVEMLRYDAGESSELNISADISARWCWPMRTSGLCLKWPLLRKIRRFLFLFSLVAKTCAFESRQTKKSLKIWHVALGCFEEALFCCCLGGLPLCGQWRVGKHGEANGKVEESRELHGITP